MKTPSTFSELNQAANLPFNEGNALISQADKALVEKWGRSLYPKNWGEGYMHSSDHKAALRILLGKEPTFAEVYASWHGGSKNIDAARVKAGGGERPSEWNGMSPENRRYAVLVHRYNVAKGSKIFDGKMKDPNPEATEALLAEWSGGSVIPPAPPPSPVDPPVPPPGPPPAPPLDLAAELRAMEARITARLDQILARLPRN